MPELPEVQTTVDGLNKTVKGLVIEDVWTEYRSAFHKGKKNIKDPKFFEYFKKEVVGSKIKGAYRYGKNILIELSNGKTILIHMKMTGHLLYGKFEKTKEKENVWKAKEEGPLKDPFNRFIRLIFSFSNKKHLAFSDMRKFAKVTVIETKNQEHHPELSHLGKDSLDVTPQEFFEIFKKDNRPIKQAILDQTKITGVGNIYSDEALWLAGIHPRSKACLIPKKEMSNLLTQIKNVLKKGIDFGGDSMSDYRNIYGERGEFQNKHNAYRKTNSPCAKKGCGGSIKRERFGGRNGHFCFKHQKEFK